MMDGPKKMVGAALMAAVMYQLYVVFYRRAGSAIYITPGETPAPAPGFQPPPSIVSLADTLWDMFGSGAATPEAAKQVAKYIPATAVTGALGLPPLVELADAAASIGTPRGIRNNNPGNIELGEAWLGRVSSAQQTDSRFVQFSDALYGIRAIGKLLITYQSRYGLDTPAGIAGRWAPAHENNTAAYAAALAGGAGVGLNQRIATAAQWVGLVEAMILQENGQQPYSRATIERGLQMAGRI